MTCVYTDDLDRMTWTIIQAVQECEAQLGRSVTKREILAMLFPNPQKDADILELERRVNHLLSEILREWYGTPAAKI